MNFTIRLLRHGQTDLNVLNKYVSRSDVDLNEYGKNQSKKRAKEFYNDGFEAIYTSPMKRSFNTAKELEKILKIPIFVDERLKEIDLGCFEGFSPDELSDQSSSYNSDFRLWRDNKVVKFPSSGEDIKEALKRSSEFWNDICDINMNVIVVSHSIIIRLMIFNNIFKASYKSYRSLNIDNCGYIDIRVSMGNYTIINVTNPHYMR